MRMTQVYLGTRAALGGVDLAGVRSSGERIRRVATRSGTADSTSRALLGLMLWLGNVFTHPPISEWRAEPGAQMLPDLVRDDTGGPGHETAGAPSTKPRLH